ncbi:sulfotransferase [soil metagenome]
MERLDRRQLMARASDRTGLDDFGDVPFEEALDVLIHSLERDAKLDDARRAGVEAMIINQLTKNLHLVADRKAYPGIADEVIEAPIFILGLPRTGSTNLHGLLAQCEGIRAPRRWEMFQPSPPPQTATYETDPRIAQAHEAEVLTASDELKTRHPMTADRPEQCQGLNDYAFMNWSLLAPYELPSYKEWMLTADHRPSYEAHKRTLQHLQFRHPGRWVLKFPKHAFALDALIAVYPDAKIIWTHRDPTRIIPSAISLIETFRKATPGFDRKILGREWASYEELGIRRGLAMRDNLFAPENVFDMHYSDVIKDPAGSIERAYAYFGMTLSETSKARILSYLADNGKDKHGVHSYTAEEFGLSERMLRTLFKDYIERFNVA